MSTRRWGPGRFGMAEETGTLLNRAIADGVGAGLGIGQAVGAYLRQSRAPHADLSVAATAAELGIPLTVHVAIGTDIIHMHPAASGAALGEGSLRDFRYFVSNVARLDRRRLPELRLGGRASRSVPEGRGARAQPGPAAHRPDDGEHRLCPALSPSDQRRVSPHHTASAAATPSSATTSC